MLYEGGREVEGEKGRGKKEREERRRGKGGKGRGEEGQKEKGRGRVFFTRFEESSLIKHALLTHADFEQVER